MKVTKLIVLVLIILTIVTIPGILLHDNFVKVDESNFVSDFFSTLGLIILVVMVFTGLYFLNKKYDLDVKKVTWSKVLTVFATAICLVLILLVAYNWLSSPGTTPTTTVTLRQDDLTPENMAVMEFLENPVMILVANSESGLKQFREDGQVLVRDNRYVGLFQIDTVTYKDLIEETGLDPYKARDNVQLARILLEKAGGDPMKDWADSSRRWGGEKYPPAELMLRHIVQIPTTGWSKSLDSRQIVFDKWGYGTRAKVIVPPIHPEHNLLQEINVDGVTYIIDTTTKPVYQKTHNAKMRFKVKDPKKSARTKIPIFFLKITSNKPPGGPQGDSPGGIFYVGANMCVFMGADYYP